MKIYVGNIQRESTEAQLREAFEGFGEVTEVILIKDKYTNAVKGFGFVEMPQKEQAETAIKSLEGTMFNGRALVVNPAKPKIESGNRQRRFSNGY